MKTRVAARLLPALVVALALLVHSAEAKENAGLPDLTVVSAKLAGKPYHFTEGRVTYRWTQVTRNLGPGRAGASHSGLQFSALHDRHNLRGVSSIAAVPALSAGGSSGGSHSETQDARREPLGGYRVAVCADVYDVIDETNEHNNCKKLGYFYFAKRSWTGWVRGQLEYGGDAKEFFFVNQPAVFEFSGYRDGRFGYSVRGTVHFDDVGTDPDGCTMNGTGEISSGQPGGPSGGLTLDYLRGRYAGFAFVLNPAAQRTLYTIQRICSSGTTTQPGPTELTFFDTGATAGRYQPLPYNTRKFDSEFSTGRSGYPETWWWTLE